MSPTLREGDWLLGVSARLLPPAPGRIVVFRQPRAGARLSIKRVAVRESGRESGREAGGWFVLGDNPPRSTDSRAYGVVPEERIEAVVVARYGPLHRLAWLLP